MVDSPSGASIGGFAGCMEVALVVSGRPKAHANLVLPAPVVLLDEQHLIRILREEELTGMLAGVRTAVALVIPASAAVCSMRTVAW